MGRKSTKENKNIYQQIRDELGMTRAEVSDKTDGVLSESRLEKIENGSTGARPEDVIMMADAYNKPELCNYYCTKECQIGKRYVPVVETVHDLPQITMELLSNLNALNRHRDRVIDITADGRISDDETSDFNLFRQHLSDMSLAIETLKLWADKQAER
ncbi:MAG: helix-turn-helix transcriptional regulator [Lachnospiraceae bacterium]|nr:helix-turn-helix transcriptional regulator [Lachnospiraceae bacterium]